MVNKMLTKITVIYQKGYRPAESISFDSYPELFDIYPSLKYYFTEDLMEVEVMSLMVKDVMTLFKIDVCNISEYGDDDEGGQYGNEFGN